ncbi:dihydrolipoamide acetyltransferase family protein [Paracoccus sp. NGMCC 1.201697]|uniref:Dihydrolipoamide acetyltransferase component of pyruvate dehydrogenase complex n=1 Tax=Paracoccus broussonetiae subsp. drimophilus TaxID=3373869 RepID=A0ABW7LSG8_9RHOB
MVDVLVPLEQEGTQATVSAWVHKVGELVAKDDPLVELETDKVSVEVPAPVAGRLSEILIAAGAEARPGTVLARIEVGNESAGAPSSPAGPAGAPTGGERDMSSWHSPAVRRALAETGIDPASIKGTGRDGRLTRADVETAARTAHAPAAVASNDAGRFVPHDRMRLAIARNMLASVSEAPQVTAVFEADFSAVTAHRKRHRDGFAAAGIALSFTPYIILAAARAMRAVPQVNSRWHPDRLEVFDRVNIGIGTALGDKGLVVPVIREVQDLSLRGVATRLQDLTARARQGQLVPADMAGGTFTISNHGVSGSLLAAPIIIQQPQSAILGIGKLEKRVVVREVEGVDTIQIRPMCYVTLTIDHRVLDGHQTNAWLAAFVSAIEGWAVDADEHPAQD